MDAIGNIPQGVVVLCCLLKVEAPVEWVGPVFFIRGVAKEKGLVFLPQKKT